VRLNLDYITLSPEGILSSKENSSLLCSDCKRLGVLKLILGKPLTCVIHDYSAVILRSLSSQVVHARETLASRKYDEHRVVTVSSSDYVNWLCSGATCVGAGFIILATNRTENVVNESRAKLYNYVYRESRATFVELIGCVETCVLGRVFRMEKGTR